MCVDIENKQYLRLTLNDFNKLSNCFKKTYLIISVTKEVVQTFVFEARESFKFKSAFMLLFFFVCVFLYGMGHFLSTTKIQNFYLTLAIKKIYIHV